jgi:sugar/nucleoside kinase (ribokinase family)
MTGLARVVGEHRLAAESGDAFAAGYIAGMLRGWGPEECLRIGSAAGASCVRAIGTTTGVFTKDECEAFLRENKLTVTPI